LVIAGHDHIYERGFASGVRYVVSGGGGAPLYGVEHPVPSTRRVESSHHFLEMTVQPTAIHMVAMRDDGTLIERCGITEARSDWDCDPLPTPEKTLAASPVASVPPSGSRCACDLASSARAPRAPDLLAVAAGLGLAVLPVRRRRRG
jgi:hypothetical protein